MTTTGRMSEAAGGNADLRALLDEAGLSNAGLARALVTSGAEEGVHIGTNTTSVKRMLDGSQPRWPVPRLVAKVLSAHLHREISVTECGFVDKTPATDDRYDGLRCSGSLDGTARTIVELSGRDMDRRGFLLGSAFTAAAFSEPALFAITMPPTQTTARTAGRRIGIPDVEIISEHIAHLRRLDHRYGSGRFREQLVQLLHREANTILHGTYSEKTGKALLGAVAQASWLAGSMAADVGRHSLAQRYYIQTLNLAMSAGDRLYAANVLSHMSRLTVHLGHGAVTDDDRLRNARQAIALARAGRSVADGRATPVLSALLCAVEARGHALLGDVNATRTMVLEAERSYERARPEEEPTWLAFYSESELVAFPQPCAPIRGLPLIDFDAARIYAIPMRTRFRGITVREGMVIAGPAGWGEFCPFADYDDTVSASWLATTIEQCTEGWPEPVRDRIPINCTIPAVDPERAHTIAAESSCRTAKIKVADHPNSLTEDLARVEAVRDALGPDGAIRVDANGVWDVDTAVTHIRQLDKAASGLQYVEQPCRTIEELATLRRQVDVRIAADESIRRAEDPLRVAVAGAADVAVIKCTPLGGVRRSLQVAEATGLPCVVSSALETSVGLAAQLALAGALPELDFACGLGTLSLLEGDVVPDKASLRPVDGYLPVLRKPPTPDPDLLNTYELADPQQAAWWRDRLTRVRAELARANPPANL